MMFSLKSRGGSLLATVLLFTSFNSALALDESDKAAIEDVIKGYTSSWNTAEGKGFSDGFADDADFVNIYGTLLSGKSEIEMRHVFILKTFFKGSKLEILSTTLREVKPDVVIALVRWRLDGYHSPGPVAGPAEQREGIFTQVFLKNSNRWTITASQNTMAPLSR